jgi:hypothetical protein
MCESESVKGERRGAVKKSVKKRTKKEQKRNERKEPSVFIAKKGDWFVHIAPPLVELSFPLFVN